MREGYSRRLLGKLKVTEDQRDELEEHRYNSAAEVRATRYAADFRALLRQAMVSGARAAWGSFVDWLPILFIVIVAVILATVTQAHVLVWAMPMIGVWLGWLVVKCARSFGKTNRRRHK